jgi:hypothetical protein
MDQRSRDTGRPGRWRAGGGPWIAFTSCGMVGVLTSEGGGRIGAVSGAGSGAGSPMPAPDWHPPVLPPAAPPIRPAL